MDLSPKEELALIRTMMEGTRRQVSDRGVHFMIWGVVPSVGYLVTWLQLQGVGVPPAGLTWLVLLVLGWAASMLVGWREGRSERVRTPGVRVFSVLWIATGITLTLIALAGMFGGVVNAESLPGVLSTVIGAPIVATAALTGQRWLGWVGAGWWVGGAVGLAFPGPSMLLLYGSMTLVLMALPGAVMFMQSRPAEPGPLETDAA